MDKIQSNSTYEQSTRDSSVESAESFESIKGKLKGFIEKEQWEEAKAIVLGHDLSTIFDLDFFLLVTEVYSQEQDYPAALKVLHQALDMADGKNPKIFDIHRNMGNLYLKCGDLDAAEEKYNQANSIDALDEKLIINYGVLAIQKGQYDKAKSRFSEALKVNSQSSFAWMGLGLVHRAYADHALARACVLRSLDENPYNKLAITNYYKWCEQDGIDSSNHILMNFLSQYPEDSQMSELAHGISQ